jgi:hypothetical protein
MARQINRDQAAALAGLAAPLALTAVLIPFRASFPNTDAALALVLVVVAVAAAGRRLAAIAAAVSAAAYVRLPFRHRNADMTTGTVLGWDVMPTGTRARAAGPAPGGPA